MLFRPDRRAKAGPHLRVRVGLFAVGAVLGVAGIYLDEAWLRLVAIVLLSVGVLVRFLPKGWTESEGDEGNDG